MTEVSRNSAELRNRGKVAEHRCLRLILSEIDHQQLLQFAILGNAFSRTDRLAHVSIANDCHELPLVRGAGKGVLQLIDVESRCKAICHSACDFWLQFPATDKDKALICSALRKDKLFLAGSALLQEEECSSVRARPSG